MKRDLGMMFVPEDFYLTTADAIDPRNNIAVLAASTANAILREYVKQNGKVVFNHIINKHLSEDWTEHEYDRCTHTAILLDEKEIKSDHTTK